LCDGSSSTETLVSSPDEVRSTLDSSTRSSLTYHKIHERNEQDIINKNQILDKHRLRLKLLETLGINQSQNFVFN